MNELVKIQPPAMSISDVERVALAIAKGGLFGSKDPNAVLTLCLLAQAEGQHPAVVFRDYHIISGKPAKKAEAMLRDFITSGGKVKWHTLDDECADATFSHPSGEARIEWTLERAKQAGIATPMWKKYPRQMLRSRVISEGIRTVFPGATSGLYESGEVADIQGEVIEVEAIETGETPPKPREKLEGPYPSPTALKGAIKAFADTLSKQDDLGGLTAWLETEDVVELEKQAMRYLPGWWDEGIPDKPEFEPMTSRIQRKKRELEELDGIKADWRKNPVNAG